MSEIFERIKLGADKARFEAERLIRVNQAQSVLKDLERQLQSATAAMGSQVLALYDAGNLAQPELVETCQRIEAVRQRIAAQRAEIERIRREQPPEAPVAARFGHICPQCQIQLPSSTAFCPQCGSKAVDIAPPSVEAGVICPTCGETIPPGARFCPKDGTPVESVAAPAPPPAAVCPSCQASVPEDATFCPNCGASTSAPSTPELPEAEPMGEEHAPERIYCPSCGSPMPAEAEFCPECGHSVIAEPLQPEASVEAEETVAGTNCPNCGTSLPAEAIFCSECGSTVTPASPDPSVVEASAEVPEVADVVMCPSCNGSIPAGVEFCPLCGQAIEGVSEALDEEEATPPEEPDSVSPEEVVGEQVAESEEPRARAHCPNCGASIPAEADFCPECGQPVALMADELPAEEAMPEEEEEEELSTLELAVTDVQPEVEEAPADRLCPNCNAPVPSEAEFCPECGEPVPGFEEQA